MSTKDFSLKQENMVSGILGWNRVMGSGAVSCTVGDVISEKFVGECKTHTERSKKVIFRQDVWNKIKQEAMTVHKIPVLFVDNGTQQPFNTYCITVPLADMSVIPSKEFNMASYDPNYQKQLNFDIQKLEKKINKKDNTIFVVDWFEPVLLMSLETFDQFQIYA